VLSEIKTMEQAMVEVLALWVSLISFPGGARAGNSPNRHRKARRWPQGRIGHQSVGLAPSIAPISSMMWARVRNLAVWWPCVASLPSMYS